MMPIWGIENWSHGSLHLKFEGLVVGTGSEHCDFGADSPIIFQSGADSPIIFQSYSTINLHGEFFQVFIFHMNFHHTNDMAQDDWY